MQPSVIQYYNKIYLNNVNDDIGRALFVDDRAIWKSRLNIACVDIKNLKESSGLSGNMGKLLNIFIKVNSSFSKRTNVK